jgi:hypothetical protein
MLEDLRGYYFSRYGLAETLVQGLGANTPEEAEDALQHRSRDEMEAALEERVQQLLGEVRAYFPDPEYPPDAKVEGQLVQELDGTPGEQVGENGYFVRPHVLLGDGQLNGRYGFVNSPLPGKEIIQRYYPPATKLSVGKASASNVKKTRLFALACTVTTLTPLKAARRTGGSDRGAVIPDLPLAELISYLDLYVDLQPSLPAPTRAATSDDGKPYLLQNRGTFPDPPPGWTFGTLGVVAGIGSWARKNGFFEDAEPVLEALATRRAYVIDTTGDNRVESAGSHVVSLAREGVLHDTLSNAWKITSDANEEDIQRLLRRWLLHFNESYFKDFLALRAIYPPSFSPLIDAYFMQDYEEDLIASARVAAQHINTQAYHAADGSTQEAKRENKQTILSGLESMLYDCSDGPELIARISAQVGRLTGSDFPPEARAFFDRTTAGDLSLEEARNLLVAYMRLREPSTGEEAGGAETTSDAAEATATEDPSPEPPGSSYSPDDELSDL